MSLPTNSRILKFPVRIKECGVCGGTLLPEKPWHNFHRECFHWRRATRFVLGADREFQAMRLGR